MKNTIFGANELPRSLDPQQLFVLCADLDNLSKEYLVLSFAIPHRHLAWFLNRLPRINRETWEAHSCFTEFCNTAHRTCIHCRMNCYWTDKPRMWLVESRGERAGGPGQWFGSSLAFSSWEALLNLLPCAGDQNSVPVCDSRHMTWARKKPKVLGGLACAALARWLLLLKETAGF